MPTPQDSSISVWQLKPWWCQPWSIGLTSAALIGGSWLLTQRLWITILVAVPVLTWMSYFVLVYPKLVMQSGMLSVERDQPEIDRL